MTFRAGGIISGLDTNSIIEQLVALERIPIGKLEQRQQILSLQKSLISEIETALSELVEKIAEMDTDGELLSYSASSSNEDVLRAQASGNALPGTHTIVVEQLARAEQDRSSAFDAETSKVRAGTLTLTVQGEDDVDITIAKNDTLADVAYAINTSGARVSASIINTGTECYLTLYAHDTGHEIGSPASDALTIEEKYTGGGGGGKKLNFVQTQEAQNARIVFDGLSIERRSNTISDVVSGLDLTLLDDTSQPTVEVTIQSDTEGVREKLDEFVSAYNNVIGMLGTQFKYTEGQQPGVLFGDSTLRNLMVRLQSIIADEVAGVVGDFSCLGLVGIQSTSEGTISLDGSKLDAAMASDFRGVASLFTTATTGILDRLEGVVDDYTDPIDGMFKYRKNGIDSRDRNLSDQIENLERRVAAFEERLVAQFTYLETVLGQLQSQQGALASLANLVTSGT